MVLDARRGIVLFCILYGRGRMAGTSSRHRLIILPFSSSAVLRVCFIGDQLYTSSTLRILGALLLTHEKYRLLNT